MKLIPLIYQTATGKIKVIWCGRVSFETYNSAWWGEETDDPVIWKADVDILEKIEIFDSLEEAHDSIAEYYKSI